MRTTDTLFPETDSAHDLSPSDHLALSSFRYCLVAMQRRSPETFDWLLASLRRSIGDENAAAAVVAMSKLVATLAAAARRNISYHQPCCPCLSVDESHLLTMVSAARRGEIADVVDMAAEFVYERAIGDLVECVRAVAGRIGDPTYEDAGFFRHTHGKRRLLHS
ncbi:MAG: hypothetical protein CMM50_12540 [Rhodospirillaceae bacterium]|nr:hypothetical protein [Rhodospirillaceae bacterium]|tara:strand:+ start:317 stop:808 length:492 start_codon:yes stop_codon:yes gene_type:complete